MLAGSCQGSQQDPSIRDSGEFGAGFSHPHLSNLISWISCQLHKFSVLHVGDHSMVRSFVTYGKIPFLNNPGHFTQWTKPPHTAIHPFRLQLSLQLQISEGPPALPEFAVPAGIHWNTIIKQRWTEIAFPC